MIVVAQSIIPGWIYAGAMLVLALGIAYECAEVYSVEPVPLYYLGP